MTLISSLQFAPRYFWNSSGWNHEIRVIYSINRRSFDASRRRDREGVNNVPARVHFYHMKWDLQLYARWKYRFTSTRTPFRRPFRIYPVFFSPLFLSPPCVSLGHVGTTHVPWYTPGLYEIALWRTTTEGCRVRNDRARHAFSHYDCAGGYCFTLRQIA